MISAETFLRRSVFAPLILPLVAGLLFVCCGGLQSRIITGGEQSFWDLVGFWGLGTLGWAFILGGIPYSWMLVRQWSELSHMRGKELERTVARLPLEMLPYYWKVIGAYTVLALVTIFGAIAGVFFLAIGTVAIPALGYLYVGSAFALLRLGQWLGWIER